PSAPPPLHDALPICTTLAQLIALYGEEEVLRLPLAVVRQAGERNLRLIARLIAGRLNTPPTSSAGRLFDAVAALVGVPGSRRVTDRKSTRLNSSHT